MEPYKTSEKMFDYLVDNLERVELKKIEELLFECKIIGVELAAESVDEEKTVEGIFLYLERPDGSRFVLNCSAFLWDEKWKVYDPPTTLLLDKAEFPKEVM